MKIVDFLKQLNQGEQIKVAGNLGYVVAPNSIRRCFRLSQEERLLLIEIYNLYNDEKGCAFPTQQTLAMYLGVTASTISKLLAKLEEKKFIKSYGKKGKRKKYVPFFDLRSNPYYILSEATHFATKKISEKASDKLDSNWGNKFIQFINVSKSKEFTDSDPYGSLILKFHSDPNVLDELFSLITEYISSVENCELNINWKSEISKLSEKEEKKAERRFYKKKKSRKNQLELDPETLSRFDRWEE